jgi:hypothetical protein
MDYDEVIKKLKSISNLDNVKGMTRYGSIHKIILVFQFTT